MSMAALMQIGALVANFAGEVVEDPDWKRKLKTFGKSVGVGAQIGSMAGAFASPSTGLKIAGGKLGDLGESTGMINPKGFGAFDGALKEGATFGQGINKLPESIGGNFKSPSWNAPESLFNPPGETKPFDWSLFR